MLQHATYNLAKPVERHKLLMITVFFLPAMLKDQQITTKYIHMTAYATLRSLYERLPCTFAKMLTLARWR
jgi:hypothetical protein